MAKNVSGSLGVIRLDGIKFTPAADINVTEINGKFEIEMLPGVGQNMKKMTRRVQTREGVVLLTNAADNDLLIELANRVNNFSMSYESADGTVHTSFGCITYEGRETDSNRTTIQMLPADDSGWKAFIA